MSLRVRSSIGMDCPQSFHFRKVDAYSFRVPRDKFRARRYDSAAISRLVDIGRTPTRPVSASMPTPIDWSHLFASCTTSCQVDECGQCSQISVWLPGCSPVEDYPHRLVPESLLHQDLISRHINGVRHQRVQGTVQMTLGVAARRSPLVRFFVLTGGISWHER